MCTTDNENVGLSPMILLALLEVEKGFRRISGYKELPQLMAALERESTEG